MKETKLTPEQHEEADDAFFVMLNAGVNQKKVVRATNEFLDGPGEKLRNGELIDFSALMLSTALKGCPNIRVALRRFFLILSIDHPGIKSFDVREEAKHGMDNR